MIPSFEEALARLLFVVEHRRPSGVVVGQAGTGKSALIEVLREELATRYCTPIVVDLQTTSEKTFASKIAYGMGLSPAMQDPPEFVWTTIEDRLAGAMSAEMIYVPLFDHLEHVDAGTAAAVTRCCHLFAQQHCPTLLFSRPPLPSELLDVIRALCDLRIELPAWSIEETVRFVAHSVQDQTGPRYTGSAIAVLHHFAGGRLGDVQQLLRLTSFAAEAREIEKIDAEFVESIASEIWRPVAPSEDTSHHPPTILELAAFSQ